MQNNAFQFMICKLKIGNKLYTRKSTKNNEYNRMSDSFVYIISHHYFPDDFFYSSYQDLHKIYQTDKEAFQKIYSMYSDEDTYHFKVIKYKMNKIDRDEQINEVLYDSYKHVINESLQVIKREKEEKEEYPQVRRLYYLDNEKED